MPKKSNSEQLIEQGDFLLNMQILADSFEESFNLIKFCPAGNRPTLKSIRHYRNGTTPSIRSVYILWAFQINENFKDFQDVSLIIIGECNPNLLSDSTSYILLSEDTDLNLVYDHTTDIFLKYSAWNLALQRAYYSDNPLNDMLQVSIDIFKNPLFVHDTDFYILACPNRVAGMPEWMVDSRNGRLMLPLDIINDFKIDPEYLHTLQMHEADMFSANQRGYRILYVNLWNGNHYEGRICVDEMQSLIKPGDYLAIEYLARMILMLFSKRNIFWASLGQDAENICRQALDGNITDERELTRLLRFLGWGIHDKYLVIKLGTEDVKMGSYFTTGTFGYIESIIADCHALFYEKSIAIIVNQTAGNTSTPQIISDLAYLMREGLFKMGVSNEIHDFSHLHVAYQQASIALEYGALNESMIWCSQFKDYAMNYMLDKACEDMNSDYLCAREIKKLMHYDEKHNTKLCETLETYLNLERNVVQTANALFIHRSTLFYRLDRIKQITELNLDDVNTRLYLQISYLLLK